MFVSAVNEEGSGLIVDRGKPAVHLAEVGLDVVRRFAWLSCLISREEVLIEPREEPNHAIASGQGSEVDADGARRRG